MTTTSAILAASTTLINRTERRLRSKERNRADWRSTLRYARVTQCTPNCDINRLRTPQTRPVLHLVLHGAQRPHLSADCTSLFGMSRSNPSSDHSRLNKAAGSSSRVTPPNLRCDFPRTASANDVGGQIIDSKKPLKTSCFQGLYLVAGIGFEPMTFRL